MTKKNIISTENAPAAVGPYSQAVRIGKLLYTAGQIALVPATGKMLEGDVSAQAEQVLNNLTAVLEAGGSSLANVVKTTVFLTDMGNYAAMNEVYSRFFGDSKPARSAVAVAALPLGALVEIEAVALVDKKKKDGKKKKK
ncbi:MAG: RidA family protein [Ardenticatenales bacterium]|nr:RidA family protein [Ardenticatenales bacterium]